MKYSEIIRLIADHNIETEVITIPNDGNLSITTDSNASPNVTQRDPMIKYIVIIIIKLPVINIFAG